MKTFIQKAQQLGQQASAFKQAVQKAPAQAAELREVIAMTAGELHQIRSEVHANINGLRSGTEDSLVQAMRDINESAGTFAEAGYQLAGLDLDLALSQRLAVQLERVAEVAAGDHRRLLTQERCSTTKSILAAILKAEEVAASVDLGDLVFSGLLVHIGPSPAVRMCWRVLEAAEQAALPPISPAVPPPLPGATHVSPIFEQTPSVTSQTITPLSPAPFAPRRAQEDPAPPPPAPTPHFSEHFSERKEVAWTSAALDRFKKMPSGSKYDR